MPKIIITDDYYTIFPNSPRTDEGEKPEEIIAGTWGDLANKLDQYLDTACGTDSKYAESVRKWFHGTYTSGDSELFIKNGPSVTDKWSYTD